MCFIVMCKRFRVLVTVASIARMPPIEYSDEPLSGLTFRSLRTRYRAKSTVSFFEGVLLHLADETPELTMVVDPLLAETCLILG